MRSMLLAVLVVGVAGVVGCEDQGFDADMDEALKTLSGGTAIGDEVTADGLVLRVCGSGEVLTSDGQCKRTKGGTTSKFGDSNDTMTDYYPSDFWINGLDMLVSRDQSTIVFTDKGNTDLALHGKAFEAAAWLNVRGDAIWGAQEIYGASGDVVGFSFATDSGLNIGALDIGAAPTFDFGRDLDGGSTGGIGGINFGGGTGGCSVAGC